MVPKEGMMDAQLNAKLCGLQKKCAPTEATHSHPTPNILTQPPVPHGVIFKTPLLFSPWVTVAPISLKFVRICRIFFGQICKMRATLPTDAFILGFDEKHLQIYCWQQSALSQFANAQFAK